MCWLTNACPSTTSVMAFFKSAPMARIGRADGNRGHRAGSIAARAAQNHWAENSCAGDRIVHASRDGALADQECVGNPGEPFHGLIILIGDRLARTIGAGHHQNRRAHRRQIRDGAAACTAASRPARRFPERRRAIRTWPRARTIGRARRSSSASASAESTTSSRHLQIAAISANGFSLRIFPLAQRVHGGGVARIAGQMIAAEPFDRDDSSCAQQFDRPRDAGPIARNGLISDLQIIMRTAYRAGHRLSVKTPVGRDRDIARRKIRRAASAASSCSTRS